MKRTLTSPDQLTDEHTLTAATMHGTVPVSIYDDGYGPLWIHRDSMGVSGIVRAQRCHEAYEICEDEFFPAADEEAGEEYECIEAMEDGEEKNHAQACFDEAYGNRSNSRRMPDGTTSSTYARDLNGDQLDRLTAELAEALSLTLEIDDNAPEPEPTRYFIWNLTRRPTSRGRTFLALWSGRYGTRGSQIRAGYRGTLSRPTHEAYNATHEDPTRPDHNPEA
jgi:hypothetical protein